MADAADATAPAGGDTGAAEPAGTVEPAGAAGSAALGTVAPVTLGPAALADRLRAVAADPAARPLLVALDLDGTLAPLRDDPMSVRAAPGGEAVLARLAGTPDVHLALVSGRAMAQLPLLVDLPVGTLLVGSHGAERARVTATGLDRAVGVLSDEQADALASLGGRAAAVARGRDGVWVETKPAAVVVHTRLAAPDVAAAATSDALALADAVGIRPLHGKDVVELPVLDADKGSALAALRAELGARVVLYAGDDVTDEHAFAALSAQDVGVKVGVGQTTARFRVAGPDDVVVALVVLADALGH